MTYFACDIKSAFEDGGIGGLIVLAAWLVKHFFFTSKNGSNGSGPAAPVQGSTPGSYRQ